MMIKFFRKERLKQIRKNGIGRYLAYALGEIILVIAGILIALQINNKNEKTKEVKFALNQLDVLASNLEKANRQNSEIYFLRVQDSILQALRHGKEDLYPVNFTRWYDKNPMLLANDLEYAMNENLDNVLNLEETFPKVYRPVIQSIKNAKSYYENLAPIRERLQEIEARNTEILSAEFDWFDDYNLDALAQRKEYFVNDPFFQNRLFDYIQNFGVYASQANRIRMMKAKIWQENQIARKLADVNKSKKVFEEMDFVELRPMNCEDPSIEQQLPSFIVWNLVYNTTKDTIALSNWGVDEATLHVLPQSVEVISGRIKDGIRMYEGEECVKKYANAINGYILIE